MLKSPVNYILYITFGDINAPRAQYTPMLDENVTLLYVQFYTKLIAYHIVRYFSFLLCFLSPSRSYITGRIA